MKNTTNNSSCCSDNGCPCNWEAPTHYRNGRGEYVRAQQDASPTFHRIRSADGQLIDHRPEWEQGR